MPALHCSITNFGLDTIKSGAPITGSCNLFFNSVLFMHILLYNLLKIYNTF